ncbi:MAG: DUF4129 domain-containing protein [Gemmatimonadales bacterium]|jgi:hypothetical protein
MTMNLLQWPASDVPPDSIRAVVRGAMSRGEFNWRERPVIVDKLAELWRWLMGRLEELGQIHPVAYWLIVAGLLAILMAILVHIGWTLSRAFRQPESVTAAEAPSTAALRDASWHRGEAERLRAAGRFIEALAHHFIALLLDLDQRKIVRFHPSKTPREYVDEAGLEPAGQAAFADLVSRLYGHVFGGVACSEDELDLFERRAAELGGRVAAQ